MEKYKKIALLIKESFLIENENIGDDEFNLELAKKIKEAFEKNENITLHGFQYVYTLDIKNTAKYGKEAIFFSFEKEEENSTCYGMIYKMYDDEYDDKYDEIYKVIDTNPNDIENYLKQIRIMNFSIETLEFKYNRRTGKLNSVKSYCTTVKKETAIELVGEELYNFFTHNMLKDSNNLVKNTIYKIY